MLPFWSPAVPNASIGAPKSRRRLAEEVRLAFDSKEGYAADEL